MGYRCARCGGLVNVAMTKKKKISAFERQLIRDKIKALNDRIESLSHTHDIVNDGRIRDAQYDIRVLQKRLR